MSMAELDGVFLSARADMKPLLAQERLVSGSAQTQLPEPFSPILCSPSINTPFGSPFFEADQDGKTIVRGVISSLTGGGTNHLVESCPDENPSRKPH